MSAPGLTSRIAAAKRAVLGQAAFMHREFGRVESKWKADGTRVTAADLAISEAIVAELRQLFPEDQFLSEELALSASLDVTAEFAWVLDPIDGTNNFALGIPQCAISLGICHRGEPVYGVIYDLGRKTLMHGGPGHGAWDGERTIKVITAKPHSESIIGMHSPSNKAFLPLASGVLAQFKIRGLGSATLHLAYVAAGILDGCVDFNVKIWDLAAAIPLVRAAGGEVHFVNGDQLPIRKFDLRMPGILYFAGSPEMCARLRAVMQP